MRQLSHELRECCQRLRDHGAGIRGPAQFSLNRRRPRGELRRIGRRTKVDPEPEDDVLQTAGPSDIVKTVPEGYLLGDRAVYLAAFDKVREAISTDGRRSLPPYDEGVKSGQPMGRCNCRRAMVEASSA